MRHSMALQVPSGPWPGHSLCCVVLRSFVCCCVLARAFFCAVDLRLVGVTFGLLALVLSFLALA